MDRGTALIPRRGTKFGIGHDVDLLRIGFLKADDGLNYPLVLDAS